MIQLMRFYCDIACGQSEILQDDNLLGLCFRSRVLGLCLLLAVFAVPGLPAIADVKSTCGIAAGETIEARDIEIRCGLTFDQIKELFQELSQTESAVADKLVEVSEKLGVHKQAIRGFVETIKREKVPDEKLVETFATVTKDYLSLLNERQAITTGGPDAEALLRQVENAIDLGQIAEAKLHMTKLIALRNEQRKKRQLFREEFDKADLDDAEVDASAARISLLELDYKTAAKQFEQAAMKVPEARWHIRGNFLHKSAHALLDDGIKRRDEEALKGAIDIFRRTLKEWTRERAPLDWATVQSSLGTVLLMLGVAERSTARLEEAIVALRAALEECKRDRVSDYCTTTQNSLGIALAELGNLKGRSALLEEAVAAFRAALEKLEPGPDLWVATQYNLGGVLRKLYLREGGTRYLREAARAYRSVLLGQRREEVPLEWAETQHELGNMLLVVGQLENESTWLMQAAIAYEAALEERTRKSVPLLWIETKIRLSITLWSLGIRLHEIEHLDAAKLSMQSVAEFCDSIDNRKCGAQASAMIKKIEVEIDKIDPAKRPRKQQ